MKKEGSKPRFRSEAKRATYDLFERQLRQARRSLADNRHKIKALAKEQAGLKSDVAALSQLMWEFRK